MRVCAALFFCLLPTLAFANPAATASKKTAATIIQVQSAITRQVPSGKAKIQVLATGKNAFVGRLWMAAGGAVPLHRDPTEEYIYIVSGGGMMTIDGKTTQVGPGTMVYMPANAEVTYKNGDQPLVALQVFAGPESAAKYDRWQLVTPAKTTP
jgi:quercetin dioxygenase-like cupin family protein